MSEQTSYKNSPASISRVANDTTPRTPTLDIRRSDMRRRRERRTSSSCSSTVGYGATSAFGGPCYTPNLEKLAANGLKFTRFHTTALCSPTRQANVDRPQPSFGGDGRHHRNCDLGAGYNRSCQTPARRSREPSSSTATRPTQFGKCHEVPVWQTSPMGPFDPGPAAAAGLSISRLHRRRDEPVLSGLYEGTTPVEPGKTRGRLPPTTDMTTKRSTGSASRRRSCPTGRSSPISRRARRTRPTTSRRNGLTSTRAIRPGLGQAARGTSRDRRNSG